MSDGFAAPGAEAPAVLPGAFLLAALASRPMRTAGAQPVAVVLLFEVDAKGFE
ncbi:hypothetical protein [Sandarakinorhabdus sp.]|uniref:hypothetical protein n=1 Tax=Sandarakinorhabdus sp. TaxID=1916663 RepID=UPI003569E61A